MIDGRHFYDQAIKNYLRTYNNIKKIATGQGDGYATECLLDYPCFKEHYQLIEIGLGKQQKLNANPKAIQKISFTRNLNTTKGATMFLITEEAKETALGLLKGTAKVQWFYFVLI